ncbi:preprotein translocase subunit SecY [Fuerstiella marisgermanici]|uniref:Protein translocase subunit SecY n=1 Tax=Fuerstiella marisgermanici TaxID=1891926 RepID=A0A1P8WQ81_9PLAN|nr:preprotein translocase subunit SecY [Fuerstiella marisgermanici]APZ96213.1 preprotein translocase subunit [Fuerstiella marisgermanici]
MFSKLLTVFRVPELRQKILLTLGLLAVYRMGFSITLPFIDHDAIREATAAGGGGGLSDMLKMVQVFSASNITNGSIFGLGIMPYITASIVFQLLGTVYPPLEQLQKEGESGRRKLNEYTRYATVIICLLQSFFLLKGLAGGQVTGQGIVLDEYSSFGWILVGTLVMTSGTVFLMWIGEQIDAYGIGNGISLLIMAGILAQMPGTAGGFLTRFLDGGLQLGGGQGVEILLVLAVLFVAVIWGVVYITQGQRKIPIQSAKHVRGRKVMGGQRQWLPLRVNQAGVMPIIFASSLLLLPFFIFNQLAAIWHGNAVLDQLKQAFNPGQGFVYNLFYVILIYFFCYFWTAITFNPKDMSENLKDSGSFIPGYRPGGRTASHLEQVMMRITYVGAAFLAVIAVFPTVISTTLTGDYAIASFFGGTGLLIIVSVALDLVQKIDSHLVMRNYSGLLDTED